MTLAICMKIKISKITRAEDVLNKTFINRLFVVIKGVTKLIRHIQAIIDSIQVFSKEPSIIVKPI